MKRLKFASLVVVVVAFFALTQAAFADTTAEFLNPTGTYENPAPWNGTGILWYRPETTTHFIVTSRVLNDTGTPSYNSGMIAQSVPNGSNVGYFDLPHSYYDLLPHNTTIMMAFSFLINSSVTGSCLLSASSRYSNAFIKL